MKFYSFGPVVLFIMPDVRNTMLGPRGPLLSSWKAQILQRAIVKQLSIFKANLMRILSGRKRLLFCGLG
jgi:hypothetical protein